jgi:hypothetical protein
MSLNSEVTQLEVGTWYGVCSIRTSAASHMYVVSIAVVSIMQYYSSDQQLLTSNRPHIKLAQVSLLICPSLLMVRHPYVQILTNQKTCRSYPKNTFQRQLILTKMPFESSVSRIGYIVSWNWLANIEGYILETLALLLPGDLCLLFAWKRSRPNVISCKPKIQYISIIRDAWGKWSIDRSVNPAASQAQPIPGTCTFERLAWTLRFETLPRFDVLPLMQEVQ